MGYQELNHLITYLQLFGIGFGFGAAGPCLLVCGPIIIAYVAGRRAPWHRVITEIVIFLSGRILAYAVLGFLAGFSASLLGRFTDPGIYLYFMPLAGVISISLGVLVLVNEKVFFRQSCARDEHKAYDLAGLFLLGFAIGMTPCMPLVALLLEIVLISKNAFDGMLYTLFFGFGTFVSSFFVIAAAAGLLRWIPVKMLRSKTSSLAFRIVCALFLVAFGLRMILGFINLR